MVRENEQEESKNEMDEHFSLPVLFRKLYLFLFLITTQPRTHGIFSIANDKHV